MSPVCQLEMTVPGVIRGVFGVTVRLMTDGELTRLEVLRDLDQGRLSTAAAAQLLQLERRQVYRLIEGLSVRRCDGPDVEAARSSEQPAHARGTSEQSAGDHSPALLGFRADPGGGEAA